MCVPSAPPETGWPESGFEDQLPLFVYGTLRRGECNHDQHLGGRFVSVLPARLRDYARLVASHGFLVIRPEPGAEVWGELYFLDPTRVRETLEHCDRLEEIPPGSLRGDWYVRQVVSVETAGAQHRAWAYVDAGSTPPAPHRLG
jgi:gamma-glutamylcyclotransferase (GGCT)/AIG2-like uncharacterized protein YtfP